MQKILLLAFIPFEIYNTFFKYLKLLLLRLNYKQNVLIKKTWFYQLFLHTFTVIFDIDV